MGHNAKNFPGNLGLRPAWPVRPVRPRLLPVLDLMGGVVVRGVGGRRSEYRPLQSLLAPGASAEGLAQALRDRFGFSEFYLADLDAIGGGTPALASYHALGKLGLRLWIDAGIRSSAEVIALAEGDSLIVGLETLQSAATLRTLIREVGAQRLVFSLDLKHGEPLGACEGWPDRAPLAIARAALEMGVQRLLVLDLAQVGEGRGPGTEGLCSQVRRLAPNLQLTAGGGIASAADARRLFDLGVDFVLAASALHDGRIQPEDFP